MIRIEEERNSEREEESEDKLSEDRASEVKNEQKDLDELHEIREEDFEPIEFELTSSRA